MGYRITLILLALTVACDTPLPQAPAREKARKPEISVWQDAPEINLGNAPEATLDLGPALRHDSCDDLPEDWLKTPLLHALACDAEAWLIGENTWLAWGSTPQPQGHRDLHIAAWQTTRLWTATLDRSREATQWTANLRHSFIAELSPHLCAGTLFEGGTLATCLDLKTGTPIWTGRMPFWAGMTPIGAHGHFLVADLSGLSERYPFSGAEMRFQPLDDAGGRSALYLRDPHALFFAPARAEQPRLIRYNFEDLKPAWRTALPAEPAAGYGLADTTLGLVLLKMDDHLWAIDTQSGKARWKVRVNDARPSLAASTDAIWLLQHHLDAPNTLYKISPDGRPLWQASLPTGLLSVHAHQDTVVLRHVRAAQLLETVKLP